jgi:hypothetical protein
VGKCSSVPGNGARKLVDGAVMMVWKLLLQSTATATENFYAKVT